MPKSMFLSKDAYPLDPRAVSERLSTILAKYLTPSYLLHLPTDKIDGSGVFVIKEAHSQTAGILAETVDILRNSSNTEEAGE
eukprot:1375319-Amorphochlora_amoeboformis.AAC.2